MPGWNIVGSSTYTKEERDVSYYRFDGDVSTLVVPLRWPIAKVLRRNLVLATAERIEPFWKTLMAQNETPDVPGYVPFPDGDALHDCYFKAGGDQYSPWPWDDQEASEVERGAEPKTWQALFDRWYQEQYWYDETDLIDSFGEAWEVLTGIPLEQRALLLRSSTSSTATGGDGSVSKPASTSTRKKTPQRSGRPRTTSSPED